MVWLQPKKYPELVLHRKCSLEGGFLISKQKGLSVMHSFILSLSSPLFLPPNKSLLLRCLLSLKNDDDDVA
jgi:hypothetical protein